MNIPKTYGNVLSLTNILHPIAQVQFNTKSIESDGQCPLNAIRIVHRKSISNVKIQHRVINAHIELEPLKIHPTYSPMHIHWLPGTVYVVAVNACHIALNRFARLDDRINSELKSNRISSRCWLVYCWIEVIVFYGCELQS